MKRFTKLTAMILCIVLIAALAVPAFADEGDTAGEVPASTGIINADELQKMMDEYVEKYSLNTRNRSLCVGFCYLKTGDMWFYNEGKWCYSASLYKVPVSMLLGERETAGEISADTVFENQYSTGTLDTLEQKAIVNSNNDAGHALVEWMGGTYNGKCADQLIKLTDLPESYFNEDFFSVSYYNVNFYTQVLRTLYNNQEKYPRIIDYMKQAQPGAYLRTNLEGKYEVAQKYGAFEETKTNPTKNNNHAGGIIFTPNPIAVTVMTVNVDNFNARIGEIAQMLSDYALTLDSRYAAYQVELARAEQEEAERLAREEQERLAAEEAAKKAATPTAVPTVNPEQSVFTNQTEAAPAAAEETGKASFGTVISNVLNNMDSTQRIIIIAGLGIFIIGLALLIVALNMRHRRRYDDEDYDEYDEDEEDDYRDEEEMLAPPAIKRRSRKMTEREAEYYDEEPDTAETEEYYDLNEYAQPEAEEPQEEDYHFEDMEEAAEDQQEYLDESEDFLDSDLTLDQSDLDDFKSDFVFDDYSAYNDTDYKPEDSDPSAPGSRYSPRH